MIKIFYNNCSIVVSENLETQYLNTKIHFFDKSELNKQLDNFFSDNNKQDIYIYGAKEEEIMTEIFSDFTLIKAAGGLVINDIQQILLIRRLGFIDLPKGKIEKNELPEQAALREVCEECGIEEKHLKITDYCKSMFHIYPYKKGFALKETIWYSMKYNGNNIFSPQIEEDIESIFWVDKKNISEIFPETYLSIVELLNSYISTDKM